ncbi:hypothetical protein UAW_01602 [Enterococcus haemoperoxidus ATCC BAA-382]|uniref:Uncharacterized protein n=1 Tax=Enterococcus haemoperoxidus ATCC BAA-382 TaxID=1158608 RepID=R2SPH9_9ENTE|nr:hypothetical protein [Enterococcus haemoperoxidus]EOH97120.1 hypothetical protein UAW_01602 [Enterococcus haemoperoxidus ATCC BAA-382]EOT59933.1 hypothetical protein I583_02568 [Enterococcus haemoperoxidus ATCC BAA-382]OJG56114.1 hypothetical protein RV06_GL000230 [Enterococcus haemoperoxidus]
MMNGMLELTDFLGLDYYFVSLSTEKGVLVIRSLNNYCKPIDKAVELAKIDGLTFGEEGELDFICFDYEGEHFHFIDYGNHLMPFLSRILRSVSVSY